MNTETITGTITAPANQLRTIFSALNEYTTRDKGRQALTLARLTPVIVEQTNPNTPRPTALKLEATNTTELLEITLEVDHTITEPELIDPAAILAALPKKTTGDTVLSLTEITWQTTTAGNTTTGQRFPFDWPTTAPLWQNQHTALAPHLIGADMLARLAKLAKHIGTDHLAAATMAHTDGKPDPRRPLTYTLNTGELSARVLIMPRRPH